MPTPARRSSIAARLAPAALLLALATPGTLEPQSGDPGGRSGARRLDTSPTDPFYLQIVEKARTDSTFLQQLRGEMVVRKVEYQGADSLRIPAYLFAPRDTSTGPRPVILFVHGGFHGDFRPVHLGQVRDLVRHGYIIIAPEYRGSTGYGRAFYDLVDYGGKEVDDVVAATRFLADHVPNADLARFGAIGYSHGGFIALHAVLRRPELFRVAVAHVPVADLPTRMRAHPGEYHEAFARQPAFGALLDENPRPYIERSPIAHARKLKTPVLVHAADNDTDVVIAENRNLRDSMTVAGMVANGLYTYREWHNPPGGHSFGVLDTREGRESWRETLAFLNRHLK